LALRVPARRRARSRRQEGRSPDGVQRRIPNDGRKPVCRCARKLSQPGIAHIWASCVALRREADGLINNVAPRRARARESRNERVGGDEAALTDAPRRRSAGGELFVLAASALRRWCALRLDRRFRAGWTRPTCSRKRFLDVQKKHPISRKKPMAAYLWLRLIATKRLLIPARTPRRPDARRGAGGVLCRGESGGAPSLANLLSVGYQPDTGRAPCRAPSCGSKRRSNAWTARPRDRSRCATSRNSPIGSRTVLGLPDRGEATATSSP